jgi:hypothetical protein
MVTRNPLGKISKSLGVSLNPSHVNERKNLILGHVANNNPSRPGKGSTTTSLALPIGLISYVRKVLKEEEKKRRGDACTVLSR